LDYFLAEFYFRKSQGSEFGGLWDPEPLFGLPDLIRNFFLQKSGKIRTPIKR